MARTGGGSFRGSIGLAGGKELAKKLKGLGPKVAKKVGRKALRAGAKVVQAEAKRRAPAKTGQLRKSIKVRAGKKLKKGTIGVTVVTGKGDFQGETFYASFLEYGFNKVPTYRGSDGKLYSMKRGSKPTTFIHKPFIRPAFDAKKEEAVQVVSEELKRGIEEAAKE